MAVVVTTGEGMRIEGETALDVVRELNERALIGEADPWRYMAAAARRVQRLRGVKVHTTSAELFLRDMAAVGLLGIVSIGGDDRETESPGGDDAGED